MTPSFPTRRASDLTRETPMQVGLLAILSLPPRAGPQFLKKLVEKFRATRDFAYPFNLRLTAPRFRVLVPAWEEDRQIDLEYHFRHSALPLPGGERELGVLIRSEERRVGKGGVGTCRSGWRRYH